MIIAFTIPRNRAGVNSVIVGTCSPLETYPRLGGRAGRPRRRDAGKMVFEQFIRSTGLAVGLMVFAYIIRYASLAVGLKPSARQGEARLRGLYRIIQRPYALGYGMRSPPVRARADDVCKDHDAHAPRRNVNAYPVWSPLHTGWRSLTSRRKVPVVCSSIRKS